MAPTLRRLVAAAPLRLRLHAGESALDRPVRWVAVSELEDPTPFLEGDELLLTTGMRLVPREAGAYVARLVARGVAGLGFGVGLGHDRVPPELVRAAAAAGLPLVEVPRETAFIAVGKVVADLLAAERHEELGDALAAQGRLTRAALRRPGGPGAVVGGLAREIGGWAALLDESGAVRHAAGAGAPAGVAAVQGELDRLRAPGHPASLSLSGPGEHVVVRPLGESGRVRGFVVVGGARPFTPVGHTVVNTAGSLLALALEQQRERLAAARGVRAVALRQLLAGDAEAAGETLAAVGPLLGTGPAPSGLPTGPVAVLACAPGDAEALLDALAEAGPAFAAASGELVVVLVAPDEAGRLAEVAAAAGATVGVSRPVPASALPAGLPAALEEARRALGSAAPVMRFADLAGRGLAALVDPESLAAFAAALLAPLREYGSRADLVESLRAYLACNGHWDAAAHRLGVHRHTLRYRMRRVAELLGRDLEDPGTRAELWIALSAAGQGERGS
ncbi:PucR family transcriptional regulator [Sphaerisporangium rufum]|uniref:PucR family transcriptional regulator n=1 Tax=Sphaerisporangium rufum TaxID=1381558 RepID=A0A919R6M8_9ACTN|nr:PucR family transcriptional regulator [Sphaerisporangium rufum]GII78185.1 PucR family transcriptional regulator [Sphaerisporangium rufum]